MKKIVKPILTILLVLGVPAKAAMAAPRLTLSPVSGSYNKGTEFTVKIGAQSEGKKISGVDVVLNYDATKLDVIGNPTLESGVNFIIYPKVESGKITVTLVKDKATDGLESTAVAGDLFTIKFKGKETGTAKATFSCTPSSLTDSNLLTTETGTVVDVISCADNQAGSYEITVSGNSSSPTNTPTQSTPAETTSTPELPKTGNPAATIGFFLLGGIGLISAFILKAL